MRSAPIRLCFLLFLSIAFVPDVPAQVDADSLILKNGDTLEGPVSVAYKGDTKRIDKIAVRGRVFKPASVRGYQMDSEYFRVLRETRTGARMISGKRYRIETVEHRPVKRLKEGRMNLYSTEIDRKSNASYEYFDEGDGSLKKVNYDNLGSSMSNHSQALSQLGKSNNLRKIRTGSFILGIGLTSWGVVRGTELQSSIPEGVEGDITFRITIPLIGGVASLISSYLLDRKVKSLFRKSIDVYNGSAESTSLRPSTVTTKKTAELRNP